MPCGYKKYPSNWKSEIRPAILERAYYCCEKCGAANYSVVSWCKENKIWNRACGNILIDAYGLGDCTYQEARFLADHWNEIEDDKKWIVIVLTISHLNHDTTDNRMENLAALCQRCHINHDKDYHKANAKATIEKKKGLQSLF